MVALKLIKVSQYFRLYFFLFLNFRRLILSFILIFTQIFDMDNE